MPFTFRDAERDAQLDFQALQERFKEEKPPMPVVLCDIEGRFVDDDGNPVSAVTASNENYVFAREWGESTPSPYLNRRNILPIGGIPCWAGYDESSIEKEILGLYLINPDVTRRQTQDSHVHEHETGGYQPLNVYLRMLVPLRVTPLEGLVVQVAPLVYEHNGQPVIYPGTNTLDLTSNLPASGLARYTLIYLDPADNTVKTLNGTTVTDSLAFTPPLPTPPSSSYPSAWVRLAGGQTQISEAQDIVDGRMILSRFEESGGTRVKNTSGATADTNDVGYIASGEYKTTTTPNDPQACLTVCVVIAGGANNADIYVQTSGRVIGKYTSTAPSAGDKLFFSTVAGQLQVGSVMRPELAAIAQAAGSGGLVEMLLYPNRPFLMLTDSHYFYGINAASSSDFVATIATLPGGATLTYNAPSSGNEDAIAPWAALDADFNAKLVLHNTTRGTSALISAVNTGTNTITLTANVPAGWATTDTITTKSQTNTDNGWGGAGSFFFDLDLSGMTTKPALATAIIFHLGITDTGASEAIAAFHPFEANSGSKNFQERTQAASRRNLTPIFVPIIQNKICSGWAATGTGTLQWFGQHIGWIVAAP